jgi:hypothetical protein
LHEVDGLWYRAYIRKRQGTRSAGRVSDDPDLTCRMRGAVPPEEYLGMDRGEYLQMARMRLRSDPEEVARRLSVASLVS